MHGEPTSLHLNGREYTVGLTEVGRGRLRLWMEPGDAPGQNATVKMRRGQVAEGWYVVESVLRLPDPPVALVVLAPIDPPGKRVLPKPAQAKVKGL